MAELILEPYAATQRWHLPGADGHWEALLAEYLESLASRCAESGECVIGHIKALALFANCGYLRLSVVSSWLPASVMGKVPPGTTELTLSLNVIVYGLAYEQAEHLSRETAVTLADRWKGEVEIEATGQGPQPPTGPHTHHIHPHRPS
jgi:hypothetical protein